MLLEPIWHLCERHLFSAPVPEGLFNPYHDHNAAYDRPEAVAIRRANFRNYLACYAVPPPVLLLAEAPGPWGCRFSGVPVTSEAQLVDTAFPIPGAQSSLNATPYTEYSAGIYWRILAPFFPHFFTWNSVPCHPYKPGNPLSIRTPSKREVLAWSDLLAGLLDVLRPARVLAVGRKAEQVLNHLGVTATYVRHPSQGGARRFEAGVRAAFETMGLTAAS